MGFRDNLQYLRSTRNMTQEQLAELLGVSRQSVTKWEAERSYPEMDKLIRICSIFECSLDDLVQGDLAGSLPSFDERADSAEIAADTCGYDEHMRAFAFLVPTGIACIVLGVAWASFFDDGCMSGVFKGGDFVGLAGLFCGIAAALACLVPAGMKHSAFVKAHPYVEDFYTAAQKERAGKRCAASIVAGVCFVFLGVLAIFYAESTGLGISVAETVLFLFVAAGVWLIVNGSMLYAGMNLGEYNKQAVVELDLDDIMNAQLDEEHREALLRAYGKSRKDKVVGNICAIIMLLATIAGIWSMFHAIAVAGGADAVDWLRNYFWLAWVVGGILCGITCLAAEIFYKGK